jgi:hypothetical protein
MGGTDHRANIGSTTVLEWIQEESPTFSRGRALEQSYDRLAAVYHYLVVSPTVLLVVVVVQSSIRVAYLEL